MKKIWLLGVCLILIGRAFGQLVPVNLRDDLFPDKYAGMEKFLPLNKENGRYSTAFMQMPADTFISRVKAFQKWVVPQIESRKDTIVRKLLYQQIDYLLFIVRRNYSIYYGMKVGADSTLKIAGELSASERERLSALGLPAVDYNNTRLYLSSAAYREWVDICLYNDASRMKPDTSLGYAARKVLLLKAINEKVTAPLIKAKLLYAPTLFVLKAVKQPDVLAQVYSDLMASEASLTEKTEVTEVYQNITAYKNGSMAPDFSYADINGKMISLKSFRGKYTYIDIWATWCAPCKAEIPHLAKLEARFGKQINFISLSIDYQKDKPTWKNFVKTQHLKGIQVIADNASKSDFVKKLNIVGIPRFVLIDPEGRITAAEALFPSDPKLALQLKQLVKK